MFIVLLFLFLAKSQRRIYTNRVRFGFQGRNGYTLIPVSLRVRLGGIGTYTYPGVLCVRVVLEFLYWGDLPLTFHVRGVTLGGA